MKTLSTFIVAGLMLSMIACKKESINSTSQAVNKTNNNVVALPGLIAKWQILTDSTFAGVGLTNHPVNYQGQAGDYFDIRTNGYIYTKEGSVFDTLSYTLLSDTTITIVPFGLIINDVPASSHIRNLSANSVTIASPLFLTPGGQFGRKVSLSR